MDESERKKLKVRTVLLGGDFAVMVDPDALDDWELMEHLENDHFVAAMKILLGEKQLSLLKEHLRDPETGRVKATAMSEALKTIMEKVAPNS